MSAKALVNNYRVLSEMAQGQAVCPMIKADGYGHGATWAARTLMNEKNLYSLGVATISEGVKLRTELGSKARHLSIHVYSGASAFNDEKGDLCVRYGLTPCLSQETDFERFIRDKWPEKLHYELGFNTGMNRLGMMPGYAAQVVRALKGKPAEWHPQGVFSHCASGDDPSSKLSQKQRREFEAVEKVLRPEFPKAHFHLAASAALFQSKHWRLDGLTDVVRPGLSLYGVRPWADAPMRGLMPVMSLRSFVIAKQLVRTGDAVGYGGTFKVTEKTEPNPFPIAVIGAGYADGVHRSLSNTGIVFMAGKVQKIVGRVSMDLITASSPAGIKVGEEVEFFGDHIDIWEQSKLAGTIPYELLTSVSQRVERVYA